MFDEFPGGCLPGEPAVGFQPLLSGEVQWDLDPVGVIHTLKHFTIDTQMEPQVVLLYLHKTNTKSNREYATTTEVLFLA